MRLGNDPGGGKDGEKELWKRPDPHLRSIGGIFKYALTFNGYEYAQDVLGIQCGDLANARRGAYASRSKWEGTFEELRCCLFFEQRRFRWLGEGPGKDDALAIVELYEAICDRWDQTIEQSTERD